MGGPLGGIPGLQGAEQAPADGGLPAGAQSLGWFSEARDLLQQHTPCRWRHSVQVFAVAKESGCTDPSGIRWHLQWTVRARTRPECTGPRGAEEMLETAREGRQPWPVVNVPSNRV